jgi:hypothetical protein
MRSYTLRRVYQFIVVAVLRNQAETITRLLDTSRKRSAAAMYKINTDPDPCCYANCRSDDRRGTISTNLR